VKGYYFITDTGLSKAGNSSDVAHALTAGVQVIQYRRKEASSRELYEEALTLQNLCRGKAVFLVNDRVDIAVAVQADGVHIGQEDLPYAAARAILGSGKIIGVTVHNLDEALNAEKAGANYLGVSPIFATTTKLDAGKPAGLTLIRQIKSAVKIPVTAIGGIHLENAASVVEAGADSLCAISAVVTKPDVSRAIREFQRLYHLAD
jgi:thiamine-phosphate pyrophosphorylase